MSKRLVLVLALAGLSSRAAAHGGEGEHFGWSLGPSVTVPLVLLAFLYLLGFVRLRARSDRGRRQLAAGARLFWSGWAVLAAAIVSPLHAAGEHSFTMHMIEHELIMLVAALLLVAARPGPVLLWAFPDRVRRGFGAFARDGSVESLWSFLSDPVPATVLQAVALWVWHMPPLFDRALTNEGWHVAQHLSFLLTALLFWWAMMRGRHGRHGHGVAALCLFVTSLVGGALGALMSFSASPWYAPYEAMGMTPLGLSPEQDQQLAGLIMWIPGGLVHAGAALFFLYKWLQASEAQNAVAAE